MIDMIDTIDVLHADDDADDAELARRALVKCDAAVKVTHVASGALALDAVRDRIPRLVVLDVNMPGMDGVETLRHLRADARFADTPIVMLTSSEVERDAALRAGATEYLIKPGTVAALVALLDPIVERVRMRRSG